MTEIIAQDCDEAIEKGIITAHQRDALFEIAEYRLLGIARAHEPEPSNIENPNIGDEPFRLIGGGNDVFVSVGIILLFAGALFMLNTLFGAGSAALYGVVMLASWLVAEFVTRQKRMKLSSTILAIIFALSAGLLFVPFVLDQFNLAKPETVFDLMAMRGEISIAGLSLFGGFAVLAVIYFWRFRVPILAGMIALCGTALVFLFSALYIYDGVLSQSVSITNFADLIALMRTTLYVPLICGMIVFGTGVAFDLYDRERISTWSDCAFWLHIVSAPLLVHPLFILATGQDVVIGTIEPGLTAAILLSALIIGFIYVALIMDRRSLLVPTLGYFGSLGIYSLVSDAAANTGIPPLALILLVIGAMIILFGAGWQRIRRLVMRATLPWSAIEHLPAIRI